MTDLAAQLWPALPLFFLAACCFVLGGFIWLVAIRRHNATLDHPTIPVVVHVEHPLAVDTWPRHRREDEITAVIGRIPPYLPDLSDPTPDDDDFVCDEIIIGPKLRQETGPTVAELDALAARLRAATLPPHAGPVCGTCGQPFGTCTCNILADCPLTTDEIRIDQHTPTPLYVEAGGTYDLTEKLKKVTA